MLLTLMHSARGSQEALLHVVFSLLSYSGLHEPALLYDHAVVDMCGQRATLTSVCADQTTSLLRSDVGPREIAMCLMLARTLPRDFMTYCLSP